MRKRLALAIVGLLIIGGIAGGFVAWAEDGEQEPPRTMRVLAPIDEVEINIAESFPPQYFLRVVSGLPNSCAQFDSYTETREGDIIQVEVFNLVPADGSTACAEIYRTVENTIPLGSDFVPGDTYTVMVNDTTVSFVAE